MRRVLSGLLAMSFGLLLGLMVCEVLASRMGSRDIDGNRFLGAKRLKPYRIPLRAVDQLLATYRASDSTSVVYDADLGWDARPRHRYPSGDRTDGWGIFTGPDSIETEPRPRPGTIRIALFGDSFTHGVVSFPETWGHYLESDLRSKGVNAEVLNLGLGGYGIDQAYLKWNKVGRRLEPDLVILGFQPENVKRDVNLIRLMYAPDTGLPFSKPRFALENGQLALLNSPAAPPESLPAILANLERWPLRNAERFYDPENFRDRPWLKSKVLAYAASLLEDGGGRFEASEREFYDPQGESGALALEIVGRFQAEAESTGATFLVVHLPRREDVKGMMSKKGALPYATLLAELERRHAVIEPSEGLCGVARGGSLEKLFGRGTHYLAAGNRVVADSVASYLVTHGLLVPGRTLGDATVESHRGSDRAARSEPGSTR